MNHDELMQLYYYVRSLYWNNKVGQLTDKAQAALVQTLQEFQRELRKNLQEELTTWGTASTWTKELEDEVSSWLSATLAAPSASVAEFITATAVGTATATIAEYNALLSFDGKAAGVKLAEGLTQEQIKQFFEAQPLGGRLLKDWVQSAFDEGVQASMLRAIREGVAAGEGYEAIVDRVMAATDIGFIRSRRDIVMLVRTYVQSANTGAQEAVFEQNTDVIKGYVRRETLDNRTCRVCALNDGVLYKKNEKRPELPAHPGCRGLWIPKTKSYRELGLDINDLNEVLRAWTIREDGAIGTGGKKVIKAGTIQGNYGEWFNSLSATDKAKTSIGPVRSRLLSSGAVTWKGLVDKKTGRPYTLAELGFDQAGNKLEG